MYFSIQLWLANGCIEVAVPMNCSFAIPKPPRKILEPVTIFESALALGENFRKEKRRCGIRSAG
jgi:hypothetical protein